MKLSVWKLLGVAGVAGVTATGVIIARDQRQRANLTPDEVRSRLHERLAEAGVEAEKEAGEQRGTP
ncbi:MAG: hypothetical protein OSB43_16435 [Nocardioides sp.]|uniref:hypothetical protein n=1 Tax=Nocardioides sp. TaxID=35761 RepID=UPI002394B1E0|nr:hypothetical protein [Nocardioides sp.]MDE0777865.1 hypothetical protein [Nocardioides sp.]